MKIFKSFYENAQIFSRNRVKYANFVERSQKIPILSKDLRENHEFYQR